MRKFCCNYINSPFSVKSYKPAEIFSDASHLIPNLDLVFNKYIDQYSLKFEVLFLLRV